MVPLDLPIGKKNLVVLPLSLTVYSHIDSCHGASCFDVDDSLQALENNK